MRSSKPTKQVSDDVTFNYKEWNQRKAAFEDSLIRNLKSSISSGTVDQFTKYIKEGVTELEVLYSALPVIQAVKTHSYTEIKNFGHFLVNCAKQMSSVDS